MTKTELTNLEIVMVTGFTFMAVIGATIYMTPATDETVETEIAISEPAEMDSFSGDEIQQITGYASMCVLGYKVQSC